MSHKQRIAIALAAFSCAVAGCNRAAENAAEAEAEPAGGAITQWTDSTELFMEHPALIVGMPDKFAVHLTDLTDFAPLRSGRVTMRFTPRDGGAPVVVVQEEPSRPGIYGPAPTFERAGVYDLVIEVESPQARDRIEVPGLQVYATAAEAPKENGAEPEGITFLKEQQWKTPGFRTDFAREGEVAESISATGEILPAVGRFAYVSAPVAGLIEASGVASSPAPGQRVARGATLAVLTPVVGEGGGSAYASARRELREAEDEYARARRLYEAQAIPQRRLHGAEIRLQAAREAVAGLPGGGTDAGGRVALRSPIAGVIAERSITAGSRVEAGTRLFTVVDPSIVWLRVDVPAAHAPRVDARAGASFRLGGFEREYRATRNISIGTVVDPTTRTVPVLYEVQNSDGTVRIGLIATATVHTAARARRVVIPSSALLEEDGRPVAYVQPEGERFERRELTIGGSERGMTLVLGGIAAGERVVTGAAYQVRLASLSTAVPAHGHEH